MLIIASTRHPTAANITRTFRRDKECVLRLRPSFKLVYSCALVEKVNSWSLHVERALCDPPSGPVKPLEPSEDPLLVLQVLPTITKLFASQDRAIRVGLLQNFEAFGPHISPSVMDEQVFPQIATGFADASPFTRELTLKSMLTIVPKVGAILEMFAFLRDIL